MVPVAAHLRKFSELTDLSPIVRSRLETAGINTVAEWLKLSPKQRNSIFGITARHIALIDRAAGGEL